MDESVYLRGLDVSDIETCYKWHSDRGLYDTLVGPFRFVSKEAEKAWCARKAAFSSDEISLAICLRGNDKHIGNIYLSEIDWVSRRGHLSMFIGEASERGKGYGQSAVRQLISYAFVDLGLTRVFLYVLDGNNSARHVYEKCGLRPEGRLEKHVYHRGEWKDLIVMGICSGRRCTS